MAKPMRTCVWGNGNRSAKSASSAIVKRSRGAAFGGGG